MKEFLFQPHWPLVLIYRYFLRLNLKRSLNHLTANGLSSTKVIHTESTESQIHKITTFPNKLWEDIKSYSKLYGEKKNNIKIHNKVFLLQQNPHCKKERTARNSAKFSPLKNLVFYFHTVSFCYFFFVVIYFMFLNTEVL